MKKTLLLGALTVLMFTQCAEEKDPFIITNDTIGHLEKSMMMKQLDSLFAQDSIVKLNPIQDAIGTQGEVEIYEKGGAKLLLISPEDDSDPNSLIYNVQIFDERYKTDKGLSISSTFKDIKDNYSISGIQTTVGIKQGINSLVVFLNESNVYLTIDRNEIPENLRYDPSAKIEPSQIPDETKFKYFMLSWEHNEE